LTLRNKYDIIRKDSQVLLDINGEKVSHLIGYKGKTIESLQSLINSMLQKEDEEYSRGKFRINIKNIYPMEKGDEVIYERNS